MLNNDLLCFQMQKDQYINCHIGNVLSIFKTNKIEKINQNGHFQYPNSICVRKATIKFPARTEKFDYYNNKKTRIAFTVISNLALFMHQLFFLN